MNFDFRKYHIRSINAANEAEKAAINQELKDLYESLSAEDKATFNEQLQAFLMKQYNTLGADYQAVKDSGTLN
jgi:hypothetical protein